MLSVPPIRLKLLLPGGNCLHRVGATWGKLEGSYSGKSLVSSACVSLPPGGAESTMCEQDGWSSGSAEIESSCVQEESISGLNRGLGWITNCSPDEVRHRIGKRLYVVPAGIDGVLTVTAEDLQRLRSKKRRSHAIQPTLQSQPAIRNPCEEIAMLPFTSASDFITEPVLIRKRLRRNSFCMLSIIAAGAAQ